MSCSKPASRSDELSIYAFIGPTGNGKSALSNSWVGRAWTKSGISTDLTKGVTRKHQMIKHPLKGFYVMDLPGSGDWYPEEAGKAISCGLKQDRVYYLIFVICPHEGRLTVSQMNDIKLILDAIDKPGTIEYSLIINKVTDELQAKWTENNTIPAQICLLNEKLGQNYRLLPDRVWLLREYEELKNMAGNNKIVTLDDDFLEWLELAPGLRIEPHQVPEVVQLDRSEQLQKELKSKMEEWQADTEKLQTEMRKMQDEVTDLTRQAEKYQQQAAEHQRKAQEEQRKAEAIRQQVAEAARRNEEERATLLREQAKEANERAERAEAAARQAAEEHRKAEHRAKKGFSWTKDVLRPLRKAFFGF